MAYGTSSFENVTSDPATVGAGTDQFGDETASIYSAALAKAGLKLERSKVMVQRLVTYHWDITPTDN
jgi:hypothetical protein